MRLERMLYYEDIKLRSKRRWWGHVYIHMPSLKRTLTKWHAPAPSHILDIMELAIAPCMTATAQYLNRNRGAAISASIGGKVFPIALGKMLPNPRLGFGWTIRIYGFIMLAVLVASCSGIRACLPRKGQFFLLSAFKNAPYTTIIGASFLMMLGFLVPFFYLPTYAVTHGIMMSLRHVSSWSWTAHRSSAESSQEFWPTDLDDLMCSTPLGSALEYSCFVGRELRLVHQSLSSLHRTVSFPEQYCPWCCFPWPVLIMIQEILVLTWGWECLSCPSRCL